MGKGRILSGMRPTGRLHIGHLSVLENWIRLQEEYDCFFFVADLHALTTAYENTKAIYENTYEIVADWLAAGLSPEKSVFFIQSHIPEHAELHLLLSMFTPLGWLERVPTYKDQVQQFKKQGKDIMTYGFLGYPLLQAADILIYRADAVPVGEDQLPHLELCREVARRFNHLYQKIFPEPRAELARVAMLPGVDGRKMSKSYANEIGLSVSLDEIKKRVNAMVTDPARIHKTDPGHPEVCVVYKYHHFYRPEEIRQVEEECRSASRGCVFCKSSLAAKINEILEPIREKREKTSARYVQEVILEGDKKARKEAAATMELVRQALKI